MIEAVFDVPDDMLVALKLTPERFRDEIRLAAAVKLLELGRLSAGAAARLAGLPVPVFLARPGDYGVAAFHMTEAGICEDAQRA